MSSLPHLSDLQERRSTEYRPQVPHVLDEAAIGLVSVVSEALLPREKRATNAGSTAEETGPVSRLFPALSSKNNVAIAITPAVGTQERLPAQPLRIGVVLSGGPAAGGHNVISGLFEYLSARHEESSLLGFIGGPKGVMTGDHIEITASLIHRYHNMGGFDVITTGRDKIETPEQFAQALSTCQRLQLNGLVVIGGDDSNTNAALLAEHFAENGSECCVVGVPKTIDGDLKNEHVEVSFGFDTATKTYAELIGNIMSDAKSSKKYYHFIRLMGRSASHIALECALITHPNAALIGEEVAAKRKTLSQITNLLADIVEERAAKGFRFGVFLVPEGLIEFIPEVGMLIQELNDLLARDIQLDRIRDKLSVSSRELLDFLPKRIREQLMLERDPHGNVQVSKIETEKLLMELVASELKQRSTYKGPFNSIGHFFGYEGRCAMPSNFDCNYCTALGKTAGVLLEQGATGMMAIVRGLAGPVQMWQPGGYPLTAMMHLEKRKGKLKPVIRKALVDLTAPPFLTFKQHRQRWTTSNEYVNPGPIQFYGPFCNVVSSTLMLEHGHSFNEGHAPPAEQVRLTAKL